MGVQEIADQMKPKVESAGFDRSVKFDTGRRWRDRHRRRDDLDDRRAGRLHDQAVARRSGGSDLRRAQPDDGVHDRQDQDRRRHVGRHGAQPVARLTPGLAPPSSEGIENQAAFPRAPVTGRPSPCGRSASARRPRRRARRPRVRAPGSGGARTDRAWKAARSFPPRSRNARSRARRRPAGWPGGRAGALRQWRATSTPSRCRRSSATDRRRAARAAARQDRRRSPPHPTAVTVPTMRADPRRGRQRPGLRTAAGRGAASPTISSSISSPWHGRAAPRAPPRVVSRFRRRSRTSTAFCADDFNGFHLPILHERRICSQASRISPRRSDGLSGMIRRADCLGRQIT